MAVTLSQQLQLPRLQQQHVTTHYCIPLPTNEGMHINYCTPTRAAHAVMMMGGHHPYGLDPSAYGGYGGLGMGHMQGGGTGGEGDWDRGMDLFG